MGFREYVTRYTRVHSNRSAFRREALVYALSRVFLLGALLGKDVGQSGFEC